MQPERKQVVMFWVRFAMLFAASWMPFPWLADTYATVFAAGADGAFAIVNRTTSASLHMAPPEHIRARGSWKPILSVQGRGDVEPRRIPLNVRIFSYRMIATFLALALAAPIVGWRRNARVVGGGLAVVGVASTALTSLSVLVEYAVDGSMGGTLAAAVETSYMGLLTPAMVYLVPLIVWWGLMSLTRPPEGGW